MTRRAATILGMVLLLTACGGDRAGHGGADANRLVGIYALDVAKAAAAHSADPKGAGPDVPSEVIAKVQAGHTSEAFRLTIRPDGTFELFMENGEVDWTSTGTWVETETGVDLTTTTIAGEPAPDEMRVTESYLLEGDHLVTSQAGTRIYMRRQPDGP